ncbi:MAG: ABC transporter ATP-binding protein [Elusimicrobia bacterium]|nr:ABC transporter ATP-binding protein [Elusimicrobiota bacterium]
MPEPIIKIKGLTKKFRDGQETLAVDHLSFEIYSGEIVGLLGPNGAGKTTLIHMLLGVLLPTEGSIEIFGMDLSRSREAILSETNFSSAYTMMPMSLTPFQNLNIFARLYGVQQSRQKIEWALKKMEIWDLRDRTTRGLSSGQISRLNLAKAILNDPKLLLLDEPTASMDPDIADKTRHILKEIQRERQMTILYTSHNMVEVETMADRILFLQKGKIVAEGSPQALRSQFQKGTLEEVFLKIART